MRRCKVAVVDACGLPTLAVRLRLSVALEMVDPAGMLARSNFITMALALFASGQVYRLSVASAALLVALMFGYESPLVGYTADRSPRGVRGEGGGGGGAPGAVYTTVRWGRLLA